MCERNELEGTQDEAIRPAESGDAECAGGNRRLLRPSLPEKLCRHEWSPGYRRFLKRQARRLMRRLAKMDPENAPIKLRHMGYSI